MRRREFITLLASADSQHTREELTALIEGRLSSASAKDELVKLATRLIVEEALEGEAGDALGREYYEHGAQPGQGYRNGYRTGRLKTAEGLMDYSAPQIAGRDEPFRSAIREHLKGHTQGLEDLATSPMIVSNRSITTVMFILPSSFTSGTRASFFPIKCSRPNSVPKLCRLTAV
jgi:hypothetical protein